MRTTRKSSPHMLLSLFAIALLCCADATTYAEASAFKGVVVEDGVKVRAGAGRTFYIVGSLKKGTTVQVDEVIFGWNKIAAPQGVYSYISKAFVDAQGDGTKGTVNRNDAPVNAASLEGPGDSYCHQLDLDKGDVVKIVGEEGSFYKVIAPTLEGKKTAFVYLPPGSVQKAVIDKPATPNPTPVVTPPTPKPIEPVRPDTTNNTNDAGNSDNANNVTNANPETDINTQVKPDVNNTDVTNPPVNPNKDDTKVVVPDIKADLPNNDTKLGTDTHNSDNKINPTQVNPVVKPDNNAVSPSIAETTDNGKTDQPKVTVPTPAALQTFKFENKELQAIEAKMVEALKLPLEDQPIADLMNAFHAYLGDASLSAQDEYFLQARVYQLKKNAELAKTLIALKAARENIKADPEIKPITIDANASNIGKAPQYDATGLLQTSGVYDGVNLPRLLRLVDPTTKRTIAYLRPSNNVDTERNLGQLVGIQGQTRLDRALNLKIIDVKNLDVLEPVNPGKNTSSASAVTTDN